MPYFAQESAIFEALLRFTPKLPSRYPSSCQLPAAHVSFEIVAQPESPAPPKTASRAQVHFEFKMFDETPRET